MGAVILNIGGGTMGAMGALPPFNTGMLWTEFYHLLEL